MITENFRKEYSFLCSQISNIEWCGSFFYNKEVTKEGEEVVLHITPKYIYLRDIGSHSYTEHEADPEYSRAFSSAQMDGLSEGWIHSHHNMSVFFSEEDNKELRENTPLKLIYPSIIVGNKGDIICKVGLNLNSSSIKVADDSVIEIIEKTVLMKEAQIFFEKAVPDELISLSKQIERIKEEKAKVQKTVLGKQPPFLVSGTTTHTTRTAEKNQVVVPMPAYSKYYEMEGNTEEEGDAYREIFDTQYDMLTKALRGVFKAPLASNKSVLFQLVDSLDVEVNRAKFFEASSLATLFQTPYSKAVEILYLSFHSEKYLNDSIEDATGLLSELEDTISENLSAKYGQIISSLDQKYFF